MRRRAKEKYPKIHYYKGRDWRRGQTRKSNKRLWLLLLIPISLIILFLCKQNAWIAEHIFAKGIYRVLSIGYSSLTSLIPFSIAEWCYILVPIFVIAVIIRFIVRLVRGEQERIEIVGTFIKNVACTLSVLFFAYTMLCGVNYYRYSFTYYSGLEVRNSSAEELKALVVELAEEASVLREKIPSVDEDGVFRLTTSNKETAKKAKEAMKLLGEEYPVLSGWNGLPKSVLLSKLMSYTEITGVFFPYTMEANVDVDISDYSIPSTMCHELSHLRGFMREDEANFLAYLACMSSNDVEIQYSGVMLALIHSGNALYRQSQEMFWEVRELYSDGVDKDLTANSVYWSRYKDTIISAISDKVNDTYLKANNQSDGVQSYGRMVDLLLALRRKEQENIG